MEVLNHLGYGRGLLLAIVIIALIVCWLINKRNN